MNKPVTHLISIAIGKYPHIYVGDLPNAVNDSQKLIHSLKKYQVDLFDVLENEAASIEKIQNSFDRLSKQIKEDDSLLIFLNGHGQLHNGELYLLLSESQENNRNTWYSFHKILTDLKVLNNNHIALLVNCCYSGNLLQYQFANTQAKKNQSRILFAAGGIDQKVQDAHPIYKDSSAFTHHICQTLDEFKDYKLSLRTIISNTVAAFEETEYGSNPVEYRFTGHGGAEFYLQSVQDESKAWKEAEQKHTIKAYQKYRRQFRETDHAKLATERIDDLKKELEAWKDCNQQLRNTLNEFIPSFKSMFKPMFASRANRVCHSLTAQYEKLTEEDRAETAWKKIEKLEQTEAFLTFSVEFANTEYAKKAISMIPILEAKQREKVDWARTQKKASAEVKRSHYAFYLRKHKQGQWAYPATRKIKEIDLYLKAIGGQSDEALEFKELDSYLIEFPKGEYKNQVKRRKEFLHRKLILNQAIAENDFEKVSEMADEIAGLNKTEKGTHNALAILAQTYMNRYESGRKKEYTTIIKQGGIPEHYDFVKKYENNPDKLVKKMSKKLDEMDYQQFQNAEITKTTEGYDYYLSLFKLCGGNYCEKAEERKIEIEYFHNYKLPEEFRVYLTQKDCLFRLEAEQQLNQFEKEERKKVAYDAFCSVPTLENSEIYFKECLEQDEQYRFVAEKTAQIKYEEDAKKLYNAIKSEISDHFKRRALCLTYLKDYSDINEKDYLEIKEIKDTLEAENELDAFQKAHKKNKVEIWKAYLQNDSFPKPLENIAHAEKMIKDLTVLSKEQNDYDALFKGDYDESSCIAFLKAYPNQNGRFYKDVFNRIFKKHNMVTDEEKRVGDSGETPNNALENLSTRIDTMTITLSDGFEKLIHQNKMIEEGKSVVDKLEKTNAGIDNLSTRIDTMTTTIADGFEKLKTHQTEQTNQANDNIKDHFKTMANQTHDHFNQFAKNISKNAEATYAHTDNLSRIFATGIDDLNINQKIWVETVVQNGQAQTEKIANVLTDGLKDWVNHHKGSVEQTKEHSEAQTKQLLVHFEEMNQNQLNTTKKLIQNLVKIQQENVDTLEQNALLHDKQIDFHFKQLNESQTIMSKNIEMLFKSIENLVETQNKIANNAAQNNRLQNEALINNLSTNIAQSIDKLVVNQESIANESKKTVLSQSVKMQDVLKKLEENKDSASKEIKEQNVQLTQSIEKNDETLNAIKSKMNHFFIWVVVLLVIGFVSWLCIKNK